MIDTVGESSGAVLDIRHVSLAFGGVRAVDDVSLTIKPGEVVALVGPNGAGKSSLVNAICGAIRAQGGPVVFDGVDVTNKPAYRIARLGLVRTYQLPTEFKKMTVLENMLVGAPSQRGAKLRFALLGRRFWLAEEEVLRVKARNLLSEFGLARWELDYAGTLSGGQRRILEVTRALMMDPKMIVLDEPTAGVAPGVVAEIAEAVKALNGRGLTFLVIEHHLDFVEQLAERVVVMATGRVVGDGSMEQLRLNPEVVGAYLAG